VQRAPGRHAGGAGRERLSLGRAQAVRHEQHTALLEERANIITRRETLHRTTCQSERRRKTHVTRPHDTDQRDRPNRQDDHPKDVDVEEREIDQILADSFPASDAPPWTLGVPERVRH